MSPRLLPALVLSLTLAACAPASPVVPPPDGGASSSAAASSSAQTDARIRVTEPQADAVVTSPLIVRGEARGPWYFEASFPVKLYDDAGTLLATGVAQAQGEWMTEDFVPFEGKLIFQTSAPSGVLVFERDNPSGLPENAASVTVPVRFTPSGS